MPQGRPSRSGVGRDLQREALRAKEVNKGMEWHHGLLRVMVAAASQGVIMVEGEANRTVRPELALRPPDGHLVGHGDLGHHHVGVPAWSDMAGLGHPQDAHVLECSDAQLVSGEPAKGGLRHAVVGSNPNAKPEDGNGDDGQAVGHCPA